MKKLFVLIIGFICSAQGAVYYIASSSSSPAGNDTNNGLSLSAPFLTVQHAINTMGCGDTLIVKADGNYIQHAGANFPYFNNCGAVTTIQSSALGMLSPTGFRTNPAKDCPSPGLGNCNYGEFQFDASVGWLLQTETHGGWVINTGNQTFGIQNDNCSFTAVSPTDGSGPTTFTLAASTTCAQFNTNGTALELELDTQAGVRVMPTGLNQYQNYYVVNCSTPCNSGTVTFQLSLTSGGSPITVTACPAGCTPTQIAVANPLQVSVSGSSFTIMDSFTSCGAFAVNICFQNNYPVTFSSIGLFPCYSPCVPAILPAPLQPDTFYYVKSLSGQTFQVSATPGGSVIPITAIGTGPLTVSVARSPSQWAFRGLEWYYTGPYSIYGFLTIGGTENSRIEAISHIAADRIWSHDNPTDPRGVHKSIVDNGAFISVSDSYLSGNRDGEAQAINGCGAPGPTIIRNNFLQGSGENTLYGGCISITGLASSNHTFLGNYYHKPALWKITGKSGTDTSTGAASGSCWYDTTDPNHTGGEWYYDTGASQWYQCTSSFTWATVGAGPVFNQPTVKDMAESKSATLFNYIGNLFNYVWVSAQQGEFFNNSQETGGAGAFLRNDTLTFNNNKLMHGFQLFQNDEYCENYPAGYGCPNLPYNHTWQNNLMVTDLNSCGVLFAPATVTGGADAHACPQPLQTMDITGISNFYYNHNTIWAGDTWSGLTTNGNPPVLAALGGNPNGCLPQFPMDHAVFQNSIGPGDWKSSSCGLVAGYALAFVSTSTAFGGLASNSIFRNSVYLNGNASPGYGSVGASNTFTGGQFPTSNITIAYNADYSLGPTSAYSAKNGSAVQLATDGSDLGADVDLVNCTTYGAANGTPDCWTSMGLRVTTGSTLADVKYNAPTTDACTLSVYSSPVRIAANQISGSPFAESVRDASRGIIPVGGLTASTQYWYALRCGASGVTVAPGTFTTRAAGSGSYPFVTQFGAAVVAVYSANANMSSPTTLGSSASPVVPVASNTRRYVTYNGAGEDSFIAP